MVKISPQKTLYAPNINGLSSSNEDVDVDVAITVINDVPTK